MPLVEVDHSRVDPERLEDPHATHAEQSVLREADRAAAVVEPGRRPALHRIVLGHLRVEQEQRDPADIDPPDLEVERIAVQRQIQQTSQLV